MRVNLKDVILSVPYTERAAMLMCSIIEEYRSNPVAPVVHMVKATKVLARYLSTADRIRVANAFRDAADEVENRLQRVGVN